jgi:hypothetical protein
LRFYLDEILKKTTKKNRKRSTEKREGRQRPEEGRETQYVRYKEKLNYRVT